MMNYNPLCMKGKTILVTGSASGIGAETAIQIAKLGGDLLLWDIDRDGLVKTENVCREFGSKVHYDVVDLIDNASINDTLLKYVKEYGKINGLVHCAGIPSIVPLRMLKEDELNKVMQINAFSAIAIMKTFAKKQVHGEDTLNSAVLISSVYGGE